MNYTVFFTWDTEANVWVATSPDIIGLVFYIDMDNSTKEAVRVAVERTTFKKM